MHEDVYNKTSAGFYGPYAADNWLCLPSYAEFVTGICTDGSYSDMLAVLAVSSVVQKPLQTVWPLCVSPGAISPLNKYVMGPGITSTSRPLFILWTVCAYSGVTVTGVNINHFVPLIARPDDADCITIQDVNDVCSAENVSAYDDDANSVDCAVVSDEVDVSSNVALESVSGIASETHTLLTSEQMTCTHESGGPVGATPLSNKFLSFKECIKLLKSSDNTVVPDIPDGPKNNVFFFVDQTRNTVRESEGSRRVFRDDCGVWESVRGRTVYLEMPSCRQVIVREGVYCVRKSVSGKVIAEPLATQPPDCEVITLKQYVSHLERDKSYQRRVTSISVTDNITLVEYVGTFPDHITNHGNARTLTGGEYVRTRPEVFEAIRSHTTKHLGKPRQIYSNMSLNSQSEREKPRNLKQVQNVAVHEASCSGSVADICGKGNLADDIQSLCSDILTSDFVQGVYLIGRVTEAQKFRKLLHTNYP